MYYIVRCPWINCLYAVCSVLHVEAGVECVIEEKGSRKVVSGYWRGIVEWIVRFIFVQFHSGKDEAILKSEAANFAT